MIAHLCVGEIRLVLNQAELFTVTHELKDSMRIMQKKHHTLRFTMIQEINGM